MKCEQLQEYLTGFLLGDLDETTRSAVETHLEQCEGCRAQRRELDLTLDLVRDALSASSSAATIPQKLTPDRRARITSAPTVRQPLRVLGWFAVSHPKFAFAAAACVVLAFVIAGMLLPGLRTAREKARRGQYMALGGPAACTVVPGEYGDGATKFSVGGKDDAVATEMATISVGASRRPAPSQEVLATDDDGNGADLGVAMDGGGGGGGKGQRGTREGRLSKGTTSEAKAGKEAQVLTGSVDTFKAGEGGGRGKMGASGASGDYYGHFMAGAPASGRPTPETPVSKTPPAKNEDAKTQRFSLDPVDKPEVVETKRMNWIGDQPAPDVRHGTKADVVSGVYSRSPAVRTEPQVAANIEVGAGNATIVPSAASAPRAITLPHAIGNQDAKDDRAQISARGIKEKGEFQREVAVEASRRKDVRSERRTDAVSKDTVSKSDFDARGAEESLETTGEDRQKAISPAGAPVTTVGGTIVVNAGQPVQNFWMNGVDAASGSSAARTPRNETRTGGDRAGATDALRWQANGSGVVADRSAKAPGVPPVQSRPMEEAKQRESTMLFGASLSQKEPTALFGPSMSIMPVAEPRELPAKFRAFGVNPFVECASQPFSTFSIDVDTASYTISRNYMQRGQRPPAEAVRTEDFVNFFDYAYAAPTRETFRVYTDVAPSKFGRGLQLVKIGVKGKRLGREEQRGAVLTFLVDTSGSMDKPDRIGLIRKSLKMLLEKLNPQDLVAIVQFDSNVRLALDHTPASEKEKIAGVLDALQCSGSTHLEGGMVRAYEVAARSFNPKAENRVLILSDGVANLGVMGAEDILAKVEAYRKQGIYCSVFGFGLGTFDDTMLQTLANKGNGAYAFIDSEVEAKRVFVDDLAATLNTIAADVKIQVEFNPKRVAKYRQIGYEKRQLKKEDFRNDTVDAGEVGSGQSVTALYEVELKDGRDALATVRLRYRRTDNNRVEEVDRAVTAADLKPEFEKADARFRLAACAAEFSELLRGSPHAAGSDFADVANVLRPVALELPLDTQVRELLRLVQSAGSLSLAAP